jgi:hypothetical protein
MLRKVLIALGILLGILLLVRWGLFRHTKQFSPAATARYQHNGLDMAVEYSQPSKKGRVLFGTEAQRALIPYGRVWRTGANEATLLRVSKDIVLMGKVLKAGRYSLWTIPQPSSWTVIVNGEVGQWGTEYDAKQDVLRVEVPASSGPQVVETFTMQFAEASPTEAILELSWDTVRVAIPIRAN